MLILLYYCIFTARQNFGQTLCVHIAVCLVLSQKRLVFPPLQIDFIAKVVLLQNLSYISVVCSFRLEPFFEERNNKEENFIREKKHHDNKGQNRHRVWGHSMYLLQTYPFKK